MHNLKFILKKIFRFILAFLLFYLSYWALERFNDNWKGVLIGVNKQKQVCTIIQKDFFSKETSFDCTYVENVDAKFIKRASRNYLSYNVQLPCMTKQGWLQVYKYGTSQPFPPRWIYKKFNENNEKENLNSFMLHLKRDEYWKSFYFYFDLVLFVIMIFASILFLYGAITYKEESKIE